MKGVLALALLSPCAALSAVVQYTPADFGGSPVPIGAGARALGMGGAFVAIADDATASTWNPSGITQLERPEAAVSGGYYRRTTKYDGGDSSEDDIEFDHGSAVYPFPTAVPQTFALSWQRQFDFTNGAALTQHEEIDLGGGFAQINDIATSSDQDGSFAAWGLSYAIEPWWGFSIGATVLAWGDNLTGKSSYQQHFRKTTEAIFTDGTTNLTDQLTTEDSDEAVSVDSGTSVVLGAMWTIDAAWTVAATCKPSFDLDLDHHRVNRQRIDDLVGGGVVDETTDVTDYSSTLIYPASAAIGAAYRIGDMQTVSADLTWTRWRQLATESGGTRNSPVNSFVAPSDFDDGYAIRIGYEHIIILSRLVAVPRIGVLYEQVPGTTKAPDSEQPEQVSARLDDYYGATVGLSLFQNHVLYDFGGQIRHADNVVGVDSAPDQDADVTTYTVRAGLTIQF